MSEKESMVVESSEGVASPVDRKRSTASVVALWAGGLVICIMAATILSFQRWTVNDSPGELSEQATAVGAVGLAGGGYFVIVCLYALAGAAAFSDAALRLVPNRFTYVALILALMLNLVIAPFCELMEWNGALQWIGANYGEWGGVALESLKGFALCFVVGVISFAARGLGGGDVKLLMALGTLAGFSLTASILLNTLAVAAVVGVLNLFLKGRLIQVLQRFVFSLYLSLITRNCVDPQVFGRTESPFCFSMLLAMILLPFVNVHAELSSFLSAATGG